MTEAQRGAVATSSNHRVGLLLYVLPQGDAAAGGDALVEWGVAIADGHALVVGGMNGQHLLKRKNVPKADAEWDVLHVAGDGVQFAE